MGSMVMILVGALCVSHAGVYQQQLATALHKISKDRIFFLLIRGLRIECHRRMVVKILLWDHRHKAGIDRPYS